MRCPARQIPQEALRRTAEEVAGCGELDRHGKKDIVWMALIEQRVWLTRDELSKADHPQRPTAYVVRPAPEQTASDFASVRWTVKNSGDSPEIRSPASTPR